MNLHGLYVETIRDLSVSTKSVCLSICAIVANPSWCEQIDVELLKVYYRWELLIDVVAKRMSSYQIDVHEDVANHLHQLKNV